MTPSVDTNTDHDLLIRLEAKVDAFIKSQNDHEARLRIIESEREQLIGSIRALRWISGFLGLLAGLAAAMGTWALVVRK